MPSWLNDFAYVVRQKPIDFGANKSMLRAN